MKLNFSEETLSFCKRISLFYAPWPIYFLYIQFYENWTCIFFYFSQKFFQYFWRWRRIWSIRWKKGLFLWLRNISNMDIDYWNSLAVGNHFAFWFISCNAETHIKYKGHDCTKASKVDHFLFCTLHIGYPCFILLI